MLNHPPQLNESGFTLVELLIVVAIIGILTGIGVPVFKLQMQRSHKTEAKLALGTIFKMENGFFSEWGAYTGRLDAIGYEYDSPPKYYTVGFVDNACTGITDRPTAASLVGQNIAGKMVDFYPNYTADKAVTKVSFINVCHPGDLATDGSTFLATATGRLARYHGDNPPLAELDLWQIDQTKTLTNVQDGVH